MAMIALKEPAPTHAPLHDRLVEQVTVRSLEDIRPAAETIAHFVEGYGLRGALCDNIAARDTMIDAEGAVLAAEVFGWVEHGSRWWEDPHLALHSPLPRACRYESEPFWCNARGFHTISSNPYLENIDLAGYFPARCGFNAAIVVPVHLPFAQISASSFTPVDPEVHDLSGLFARIGGQLGAMTLRFISGYVAIMRSRRLIPADCDLTRREVECLRWAAVGKTDHEIALIVDLSHATIRYHLNRAGEKLNAVNRAQTIFKAGQLGFLGANG